MKLRPPSEEGRIPNAWSMILRSMALVFHYQRSFVKERLKTGQKNLKHSPYVIALNKDITLAGYGDFLQKMLMLAKYNGS